MIPSRWAAASPLAIPAEPLDRHFHWGRVARTILDLPATIGTSRADTANRVGRAA